MDLNLLKDGDKFGKSSSETLVNIKFDEPNSKVVLTITIPESLTDEQKKQFKIAYQPAFFEKCLGFRIFSKEDDDDNDDNDDDDDDDNDDDDNDDDNDANSYKSDLLSSPKPNTETDDDDDELRRDEEDDEIRIIIYDDGSNQEVLERDYLNKNLFDILEKRKDFYLSLKGRTNAYDIDPSTGLTYFQKEKIVMDILNQQNYWNNALNLGFEKNEYDPKQIFFICGTYFYIGYNMTSISLTKMQSWRSIWKLIQLVKGENHIHTELWKISQLAKEAPLDEEEEEEEAPLDGEEEEEAV
jgi:hypothetical protein